jgi:hypothetical protein
MRGFGGRDVARNVSTTASIRVICVIRGSCPDFTTSESWRFQVRGCDRLRSPFPGQMRVHAEDCAYWDEVEW